MNESKQEKITLTKVIELMGAAFTEYQKAYRPDSDVNGPLYPRNKYSNIIAYMASKIWPFIEAKDKEVCKWKYDDVDDMWSTECGGAWTFLEGNPIDNKCWFCPHCGGRVIELQESEVD